MDRSLGGDAAMTPDEEYKERIKKAIDKYLGHTKPQEARRLAVVTSRSGDHGNGGYCER